MSQPAAPVAYRVQKVDRCENTGGFNAVLLPIYYGENEDGPKVGQVLVPKSKEA